MLNSILKGAPYFSSFAIRCFATSSPLSVVRLMPFLNSNTASSFRALPSSFLRSTIMLEQPMHPTSSIITLMITRGISSGRSRRGLYDGKDIRSGNNVSFSARKTRRKFKPNAILKRVYSETLDKMLRFHMTTATLRSIDKAGGLDNYLLKTKHIGEGEGLRAKKKILKEIRKMKEARLLVTDSVESPGIELGN